MRRGVAAGSRPSLAPRFCDEASEWGFKLRDRVMLRDGIWSTLTMVQDGSWECNRALNRLVCAFPHFKRNPQGAFDSVFSIPIATVPPAENGQWDPSATSELHQEAIPEDESLVVQEAVRRELEEVGFAIVEFQS